MTTTAIAETETKPLSVETPRAENSPNDSNLDLKRMSTRRRMDRFLTDEDKAPPMVLEFRDIFAEVPVSPGSKELKPIINYVSGIVHPGELVALMGPSGAGKSSLLNILGSRFHGSSSGKILINGRPKTKKFKRHIGYVLQADTLLPNLTVRETLEVTARLRLPASLSYQHKMDRAQDIIHVMGLTSCENTAVNSVSGGESKRVSIANELLINPSVLFLDEPTSGLDSTSALSILSTLKQLCERGRTVVCAIHQPSSHMFYQFDKLALMASSNLVYFGRVTQVIDYLSKLGHQCPLHYNPADFILELVTDNFVSTDSCDTEAIKLRLTQAWKQYVSRAKAQGQTGKDSGEIDLALVRYEEEKEEEECKKVEVVHSVTPDEASHEPKSKWNTTWGEQFRILSFRAFQHRRGHIFSWIRFIDLGILCLMSGVIWFQIPKVESKVNDYMAATFTIQVYVMFMTMYLGVVHFPVERDVINKERQSGAYRLSTYYLSKVISEFPVDIFFPLVCVSVFYWMVGFNSSFVVFLKYMLTSCLSVATANAFGIFIGCAIYDFEKALTCLTVTGMFMMIISGFLIKESSIPKWMSWLKYTAFMRSFYVSSTKILLTENQFRCSVPSLTPSCIRNETGFMSVQDINQVYGFNEPLWLGIVLLASLGILYHVAAYIAIRINTKTI